MTFESHSLGSRLGCTDSELPQDRRSRITTGAAVPGTGPGAAVPGTVTGTAYKSLKVVTRTPSRPAARVTVPRRLPDSLRVGLTGSRDSES